MHEIYISEYEKNFVCQGDLARVYKISSWDILLKTDASQNISTFVYSVVHISTKSSFPNSKNDFNLLFKIQKTWKYIFFNLKKVHLEKKYPLIVINVFG